jgi:hypothetical protein
MEDFSHDKVWRSIHSTDGNSHDEPLGCVRSFHPPRPKTAVGQLQRIVRQGAAVDFLSSGIDEIRMHA